MVQLKIPWDQLFYWINIFSLHFRAKLDKMVEDSVSRMESAAKSLWNIKRGTILRAMQVHKGKLDPPPAFFSLKWLFKTAHYSLVRVCLEKHGLKSESRWKSTGTKMAQFIPPASTVFCSSLFSSHSSKAVKGHKYGPAAIIFFWAKANSALEFFWVEEHQRLVCGIFFKNWPMVGWISGCRCYGFSGPTMLLFDIHKHCENRKPTWK